MYQATTAFQKVNNLTKRIRVIPGGTSASKTISILLYLIGYAQTDKQKTLTSIVSESIPHLKRGVMRDFKNIMQAHGYWKDANWNATDSIYTFETGSQIEFFSTDNGDKLRGARRDRCFMNEANNCTFDAFEQLEVRTKEFFILDFNPTNEFWAYTELNNRPDVEWLTLTYKDNEALDKAIVDAIEQRKDRKGWFAVYGLGQLGEVEGKIYKDWAIIDEIPHEARLERYGLDFGYSVDPTAIVAVYKYNGGYILDEITFTKGLFNKQIADILLAHDRALVVADSAEPKSIDEIASYGVSIIGAEKGADSIRNGINTVQEQRISVTKRSTNIIKEYRNYLWATDKNGKVISPNVPEAGFDHACFTIDTKIEPLCGDILATVCTGIKDVYEFMGAKVTADHPYLTQRGFVRLDSLRYSDKIVLWKNKSLMELRLDDTQIQSAVSLVTTLHLLLRSVSVIKQNAYIGMYGKNIMGKYLKVCTSTILMAIQLITTYLISNLYHLKNTTKNIISRCFQSGEKISRKQSKKRVSGQKQQKEKNFGADLVSKIQSIFQDIRSKEIATSAEKSISQKCQMENSATIIAKLKHLGKEEVYATVTSSGFFVANGTVVSNCDAARYAITSIVKNGTPDFESEHAERLLARLRNTDLQTI